ncbi:MAG: ATP-binding protein [Candidatus Caccosoma sp.]|nr:ATP-binding protein [Candidatus Caccosoma sp.]
MINNENLKNRDTYLNKLIAFQDKEVIKVVTGIRRSGKSKLLQLMINHLLEEGKDKNQIIEMHFERMDFSLMSYKDVYNYVKERIIPNKIMYLFFDEIQRITGWENAINALRVEFNTDIYVTGSNAYLLSSEYSTYLAGRCVEIKMYPLSFKEFLYFHNFKIKEINSAFGGIRQEVIAANGDSYSLKEAFEAYLRFGGMPGIIDVGLEQEKAFMLLEGIYSTIITRDILEIKKRKDEKTVSDALLLKKIILFLADNIGSNVSSSTIGNTLSSVGLLNEKRNKKAPSSHTVDSYINAIVETFMFYEIKRFDLKGKEYLKTLGKYYIADIGIRNYLLGLRDRDRGHILENIVYFELLRRGYDVAIGKIDNKEIDFIANSPKEKIYFQVTESLSNEDTRKRELDPLKKIKDNYEKIILSLDETEDVFDGIKVINLISWLLK